MPHPLSPVEEQIKAYFPASDHPYNILESIIFQRLSPEYSLLDIGCGRTAPTLKLFAGKALHLYGIDLVAFEADTPGLELFNEGITDMKSIADSTIDLSYSRSVMEHIDAADDAFREIHRVLKPGGRYIFLTANRYDYVSIIASLVPNKLHPLIVRLTEGREELDTFPTCYRVNSKRAISRLARDHSFEIVQFERLTQYPGYFRFSRPLFWLASQYERLLRSTVHLSALRGWILCEIVKR